MRNRKPPPKADAREEEYAACGANRQVRSLPQVNEFLSLNEKQQTAADARGEECAACGVTAGENIRLDPATVQGSPSMLFF